MPPMLDVAIGLALVFSLLSLMASTIYEWIAGLIELRGRMLFKGIEQLLGPKLKQDVVTNHLVAALARGRKLFGLIPRDKASYVPNDTFVLALLDSLGGGGGAVPTTVQGLAGLIGKLPANDPAKAALLALVNDAGASLEKAKQSIAAWFDASMNRVSGWYKRWSQLWLFVISAAIAMTFGIDAAQIGKRLWTDHELRQRIADHAEKFVAARHQFAPLEQGRASPILPSAEHPAAVGQAPPEGQAAAAPAPAQAQPATSPSLTPEEAKRQLQEYIAEYQALAIPSETFARYRAKPLATWKQQVKEWEDEGEKGPKPEQPGLFGLWLSWLGAHLLGFVAAGAAGSLGAQFWFDALNKLVSLRGAGKKPAEQAP